jgi:hypothetical protein
MQNNTYQLIKEWKYRDLDGVDHFRYFVEKNGDWLSHTNCDSLEEAEKWYDSLVNPSEQVPETRTILKTDIEYKNIITSGNHVDFDNGLSKIMGFDVKKLDDLDIRPKD